MVCKVLPTYHSRFIFCSLCSSLAKPFPPHQLLSLLTAFAHTEMPFSHSTIAWQTPTHLLQRSSSVTSSMRPLLPMPSSQGELNHSLLCASSSCAYFYQSWYRTHLIPECLLWYLARHLAAKCLLNEWLYFYENAKFMKFLLEKLHQAPTSVTL